MESREATRKAKKAIQETNGKRQDETTKTNEKGARKGNTENGKKERNKRKKGKKKAKKENRNENGKGVRAVPC